MKNHLFFNTLIFIILLFGKGMNIEAQHVFAYRIDFTNTVTSDGNNAKTTANFVTDLVTGGSTYINQCTQTNNTYLGIGGVKLSSANVRGSFTLSLSSIGSVNATQIVVKAAQYGSDVEQIAVNGIQTGNLTATPTEYTFPLDGSFLDSVQVESKLKRCYIYYIDVYTAATPTAATVATPTISPTAGFYTTAQTITLSCDTVGATIRYTLDGTDPVPTSTLYTAPFALNTTATVKARAWKTGLDSSYVASATYTFPIEVANIAAFIAANTATNTTPYKITGDVTFVYRSDRNIYIEDATGGLLIYDNSTPVITSTYTNGDIISGGIIGTYSLYNGLSELIPMQNTAVSTLNNGTIAPTIATISQMETNPDTYMSRLVKVENVTMDAGTMNTTSATNINLHQAADVLVMRNSFKTVTITTNGDELAHVTGLLAVNNGTLQLYPRNNDDISILTPVLNVSPSTLLVIDTAASSFVITAANLTNPITITSNNPDFQLATNTLPATTTESTVSVTFTGNANANGLITVSSGALTESITVTGEIYIPPIDTIIYGTGFEASEEFAINTLSGLSTISYNNDDLFYTGPDTAQWGVLHGTPTNTASVLISGGQSLQMRYYSTGAHAGHIGYAFTDFDLHNVTKVTFKAKNSATTMHLKAQYSVDGGYTWTGDSVFVLTTTAQDYSYFVSDSGQNYNVRIKFTQHLNGTPTGTIQLTIDNVLVYGVTGIEPPAIVETPVIAPNGGNYYSSQTVAITCATAGAEIRYTLDGTDPLPTSTLYTSSLTVDTTLTLKAKAYKVNFLPSNMASATYVFPIEVPNISAWKAANTTNSTTPYKITGDVVFVFRNNHNMYVEDATGGMLIYDNTTIISENYNEGDVISGGIVGTCTLYGGMRELIPLINTAPATVNNGAILPSIVTMSDIYNDFDNYESRLVRLNNVTFEAGEFNTTTVTNILFSQDDTNMIARNTFKTLDMNIVEDAVGDIIGFASIYNGAVQLYPRHNEDIMIIPDTVDIPSFLISNIYGQFENGDTVFIDNSSLLTIQTLTEGATIYFTENNTDPTISSTVYNGAFTPQFIYTYDNEYPMAIVKAIAVKANYENSEVSTIYLIMPTKIDALNQNSVTLYPNPTQTFVRLDNLLEVKAQTIILYNSQGQLIAKCHVTNNSAEISLQGMASGTYFVQIITPKGNVVKKITKN